MKTKTWITLAALTASLALFAPIGAMNGATLPYVACTGYLLAKMPEAIRDGK